MYVIIGAELNTGDFHKGQYLEKCMPSLVTGSKYSNVLGLLRLMV
jgi:hypothetical protein